MRDWLIKKLGGNTEDELQNQIRYMANNYVNAVESLNATIRELQALVPVSAVFPKKRGRPRKYAKPE